MTASRKPLDARTLRWVDAELAAHAQWHRVHKFCTDAGTIEIARIHVAHQARAIAKKGSKL